MEYYMLWEKNGNVAKEFDERVVFWLLENDYIQYDHTLDIGGKTHYYEPKEK